MGGPTQKSRAVSTTPGDKSYRASSGHRRGFLLVIGRKLARLCFAPYQRPRNFISVMEPRSRFPCDVQEFRISTALILACFRMYKDQTRTTAGYPDYCSWKRHVRRVTYRIRQKPDILSWMLC